MKKYLKPFQLIVMVLFIVYACQLNDGGDTETNIPLDSAQAAAACNNFAYSDSIFFLREQPADYIESPVTAQSGTYGAYPHGLDIDPVTGDINVSNSGTGLKYEVFFVPSGAIDTCRSFVTISGINYRSGVFVLDQNDTLAIPIYNALTNLALPCDDDNDDGDDDDDSDGDDSDDDDDSDGDDDDDDSGGRIADDDDDCEFDDGPDDDDGDGTADEPAAGEQVRPQGVDIDTLNGNLNLKQTVLNGAFGTIPLSGASNDYKINYRLNDASNRALNSIDVQLHYYDLLSNVPQNLLDDVEDINQATLRIASESSGRVARRSRRPVIIIIVGKQ